MLKLHCLMIAAWHFV